MRAVSGQVLIARGFSQVLAPRAISTPGSGRRWQRLGRTPVRAITAVEALPAEGAPTALPSGGYAIDIDANGDGWVRVIDDGAARVRVRFEAGLAAEWNGLPDALRQGVVRLTAHLFAHRDAADDAGPPAAVTALWRPWRRIGFGWPQDRRIG